MRRPPWLLVAGVAGLVAVGAVAQARLPASSARAAVRSTAGGGTAATVTATAVCPDLRQVPGSVVTQLAAGSAEGGSGSITVGSATSAAPGTALLSGTAPAPADVVRPYKGTLTGPLTVRAQGALSGSLVVEQLTRGNKTADRGWAETRCEPPRSTQWFIGAATEPGDAAQLVLANPGAITAITDITVLTPAGLTPTSAGQNLSLAPRSVRRIPLTSLAPSAAVTAVRVTTSRGEVSAAIRDVRTSGTTLLGTDWVPEGTAGQSVVVAGIPGTVNGHEAVRFLDIANPGPTDTTASVTLTGSQGSYVPSGLSALAIPAGTVRTVQVTAALGTAPAALTVTSSEAGSPIVAGVLVDAGSRLDGINEIAYLGSAVALAGPALVPLLRIGKAVDSVLVLSATGGAVPTTVTVTHSSGVRSRFRLLVPAGGTIALSLRSRHVVSSDVVSVAPDPGYPPLYGSRIIEEIGALGPLLSAFELVGAPPLQPVPRVAPQPLADLG